MNAELGNTFPRTPERPTMKKTSSKPTKTRQPKSNENRSDELKRLSRKLTVEEFRREHEAARKGSAAGAILYRRIIE